MSVITVYRLQNEAPIRLAARELSRCLRAMTGAEVVVRQVRSFRPERQGIYLGLPGHFRAYIGPKACPESRWDDELLCRSVDGNLLLSGSNPRSVLYAAYRWLEQLGASWVRPGSEGEYLPHIEAPSLDGWDIRERAGNRHRGIVIEGACSLEQVLDLIDWMPRHCLNAYMLQFRLSAYFWRRWYDRADLRAARRPYPLSLRECAIFDERVISALKERGLLLHRVGHGWTAEAAGAHPSGWETAEPASAEVRPLLAEVSGVRDWFGGIPLNTELCYSNPEARRRFVEEVVGYAAAHPEVDVLHVWASDGTNNWCECAQCASMQPSDWYISLLNEIAPRVAQVAPDMRLVALCYSNTMWPPEQVPPTELDDNCIFMFAPISRCYGHSIFDPRCASELPLPRCRRNAVVYPRANHDYTVMLRAWQEYLPNNTDSFVFEYYGWLNFSRDLLGTDYVHLLHDDVRQYRRAGLHGVLSCQIQRTAMPTSLAQHALAAYLWNPRLTVDGLESRYFAAAFGPTANIARDFIDAFKCATGSLAHSNTWWREITPGKVRAVRKVLRSYAPRLRQAKAQVEHPVWRRSVMLLQYYLCVQQYLWRALAAYVDGAREEARELAMQTVDYLQRTEARVYRWVDTPYWTRLITEELLPAWEAEEREAVTA